MPYHIESGIYRDKAARTYVTKYRIMDTEDGIRIDFPLIPDYQTAVNVVAALHTEDGYRYE